MMDTILIFSLICTLLYGIYSSVYSVSEEDHTVSFYMFKTAGAILSTTSALVLGMLSMV